MSFIQRICQSSRPFVTFRKNLSIYGEHFLALNPTPKMEDYYLLGVRNSLFNIVKYLRHARTVDLQKYVNTAIRQP
jgi:hypothetical protein